MTRCFLVGALWLVVVASCARSPGDAHDDVGWPGSDASSRDAATSDEDAHMPLDGSPLEGRDADVDDGQPPLTDGASPSDGSIADAEPSVDAAVILPPQNGGPCDYAGHHYDQCFIGQHWTGAQSLDGLRNALVLDSSLRDAAGACLHVSNARDVDIVGIEIEGCDEVGLRISNQIDSINVHIIGGSIRDTGRTASTNGSCLTAGQTGTVSHPGLVIDGLSIEDCGYDELDHGLYVQARDFAIRNVRVGDSTGNGISVRSSGVVEGCTVTGRVGPSKARIRYFNDHPCGASDTVRFLNNDVDYDVGGPDIDISLAWSAGDDALACSHYEIRGHGPSSSVEYQIAAEYQARDLILVD